MKKEETLDSQEKTDKAIAAMRKLFKEIAIAKDDLIVAMVKMEAVAKMIADKSKTAMEKTPSNEKIDQAYEYGFSHDTSDIIERIVKNFLNFAEQLTDTAEKEYGTPKTFGQDQGSVSDTTQKTMKLPPAYGRD